MNKVFIGYDEREDEAAQVCRFSIERRSRDADCRFIKLPHPLYRRTFTVRDGQRFDDIDGKPFSTDFSFSRFLVPEIMEYKGWAMFCDGDFLFLSDVGHLFDMANDRYAVMCVKHHHHPAETTKMDGQMQTRYTRKNWSSLVLWNCGHPANAALKADEVNTRHGSWLHGFQWLPDALIGALPENWNWLVGASPTTNAYHADGDIMRGIHFSSGGPWFEDSRAVEFADAWMRERAEMMKVMAV
jgi:hypothetical protein